MGHGLLRADSRQCLRNLLERPRPHEALCQDWVFLADQRGQVGNCVLFGLVALIGIVTGRVAADPEQDVSLLVLAYSLLGDPEGPVDGDQFSQCLCDDEEVGDVPVGEGDHPLGVDNKGVLVVGESVVDGFADVRLRVVDSSRGQCDLPC